MIQRFSASPLWTASRGFYEQQGVHAWIEHALPTRICNNAALAQAYASVIHHFVADCGAARAWVVELGAGTGGFAHLVLCGLDELARSEAAPAIKYVLTDLADRTLEFWRIHPRLRAHVADGRLAIARFDVLADERLRIDDGLALDATSTDDPVIVIANYVLDALPCDVLRIHDGRLQCGNLVTSALPAAASNEIAPIPFSYQDVETPLYGDLVLDEICAGYVERLAGTAFTMPVGALSALGRLARLTRGPLLVVAADKGYVDETELAPIKAPAVVQHGAAISMTVNFDALVKHVRAGGGTALHTTGRSADLQVVALASRAARTARTRAAFLESIERRGPVDTFGLIEHALRSELGVDTVIQLLRTAGADPSTFSLLAEQLRPKLPHATPAQRRCLVSLLERVRELDFPLPGAPDTALQVGVLLAALGRPTEALIALRESIALRAPTPDAWFTVAMCHLMRDHPGEAIVALDAVLALDATFPQAREWRARVDAQAQRSR